MSASKSASSVFCKTFTDATECSRCPVVVRAGDPVYSLDGKNSDVYYCSEECCVSSGVAELSLMDSPSSPSLSAQVHDADALLEATKPDSCASPSSAGSVLILPASPSASVVPPPPQPLVAEVVKVEELIKSVVTQVVQAATDAAPVKQLEALTLDAPAPKAQDADKMDVVVAPSSSPLPASSSQTTAVAVKGSKNDPIIEPSKSKTYCFACRETIPLGETSFMFKDETHQIAFCSANCFEKSNPFASKPARSSLTLVMSIGPFSCALCKRVVSADENGFRKSSDQDDVFCSRACATDDKRFFTFPIPKTAGPASEPSNQLNIQEGWVYQSDLHCVGLGCGKDLKSGSCMFYDWSREVGFREFCSMKCCLPKATLRAYWRVAECSLRCDNQKCNVAFQSGKNVVSVDNSEIGRCRDDFCSYACYVSARVNQQPSPESDLVKHAKQSDISKIVFDVKGNASTCHACNCVLGERAYLDVASSRWFCSMGCCNKTRGKSGFRDPFWRHPFNAFQCDRNGCRKTIQVNEISLALNLSDTKEMMPRRDDYCSLSCYNMVHPTSVQLSRTGPATDPNSQVRVQRFDTPYTSDLRCAKCSSTFSSYRDLYRDWTRADGSNDFCSMRCCSGDPTQPFYRKSTFSWDCENNMCSKRIPANEWIVSMKNLTDCVFNFCSYSCLTKKFSVCDKPDRSTDKAQHLSKCALDSTVSKIEFSVKKVESKCSACGYTLRVDNHAFYDWHRSQWFCSIHCCSPSNHDIAFWRRIGVDHTCDSSHCSNRIKDDNVVVTTAKPSSNTERGLPWTRLSFCSMECCTSQTNNVLARQGPPRKSPAALDSAFPVRVERFDTPYASGLVCVKCNKSFGSMSYLYRDWDAPEARSNFCSMKCCKGDDIGTPQAFMRTSKLSWDCNNSACTKRMNAGTWLVASYKGSSSQDYCSYECYKKVRLSTHPDSSDKLSNMAIRSTVSRIQFSSQGLVSNCSKCDYSLARTDNAFYDWSRGSWFCSIGCCCPTNHKSPFWRCIGATHACEYMPCSKKIEYRDVVVTSSLSSFDVKGLPWSRQSYCSMDCCTKDMQNQPPVVSVSVLRQHALQSTLTKVIQDVTPSMVTTCCATACWNKLGEKAYRNTAVHGELSWFCSIKCCHGGKFDKQPFWRNVNATLDCDRTGCTTKIVSGTRCVSFNKCDTREVYVGRSDRPNYCSAECYIKENGLKPVQSKASEMAKSSSVSSIERCDATPSGVECSKCNRVATSSHTFFYDWSRGTWLCSLTCFNETAPFWRTVQNGLSCDAKSLGCAVYMTGSAPTLSCFRSNGWREDYCSVDCYHKFHTAGKMTPLDQLVSQAKSSNSIRIVQAVRPVIVLTCSKCNKLLVEKAYNDIGSPDKWFCSMGCCCAPLSFGKPFWRHTMGEVTCDRLKCGKRSASSELVVSVNKTDGCQAVLSDRLNYCDAKCWQAEQKIPTDEVLSKAAQASNVSHVEESEVPLDAEVECGRCKSKGTCGVCWFYDWDHKQWTCSRECMNPMNPAMGFTRRVGAAMPCDAPRCPNYLKAGDIITSNEIRQGYIRRRDFCSTACFLKVNPARDVTAFDMTIERMLNDKALSGSEVMVEEAHIVPSGTCSNDQCELTLLPSDAVFDWAVNKWFCSIKCCKPLEPNAPFWRRLRFGNTACNQCKTVMQVNTIDIVCRNDKGSWTHFCDVACHHAYFGGIRKTLYQATGAEQWCMSCLTKLTSGSFLHSAYSKPLPAPRDYHCSADCLKNEAHAKSCVVTSSELDPVVVVKRLEYPVTFDASKRWVKRAVVQCFQCAQCRKRLHAWQSKAEKFVHSNSEALALCSIDCCNAANAKLDAERATLVRINPDFSTSDHGGDHATCKPFTSSISLSDLLPKSADDASLTLSSRWKTPSAAYTRCFVCIWCNSINHKGNNTWSSVVVFEHHRRDSAIVCSERCRDAVDSAVLRLHLNASFRRRHNTPCDESPDSHPDVGYLSRQTPGSPGSNWIDLPNETGTITCAFCKRQCTKTAEEVGRVGDNFQRHATDSKVFCCSVDCSHQFDALARDCLASLAKKQKTAIKMECEPTTSSSSSTQ